MMKDIDMRLRIAHSWSGMNNVMKDIGMSVRTDDSLRGLNNGIQIDHNIIIFFHMVQPNQD